MYGRLTERWVQEDTLCLGEWRGFGGRREVKGKKGGCGNLLFPAGFFFFADACRHGNWVSGGHVQVPGTCTIVLVDNYRETMPESSTAISPHCPLGSEVA